METLARPSTEASPDASAPLALPPLATSSQRFLAYFVDLGGCYALAFVLGFVLAMLGLSRFMEQVNELLFGMIVVFVYYVPQEAVGGRTLGKWLLKTRALREDGGPMPLAQVIGRTLCRFIPFEAFSFLGGNGRPRGWHDKFSKTIVISLRQET